MGKKEEDAEFAAMLKRLGVKTPKSGRSSQKPKKLGIGKKEEDAEFAAMLKRLGVKTPKDGWSSQKSKNVKQAKRRKGFANKEEYDRSRMTGVQKERYKRRLKQRDNLRHSSTKELEKENQELQNAPFKPRTDWYGSVDLPNEIKQRELGQSQIGAKSGGVIRKNKTTKGYNTGGKVTTLGVGRAVQKKIRPAKIIKM